MFSIAAKKSFFQRLEPPVPFRKQYIPNLSPERLKNHTFSGNPHVPVPTGSNFGRQAVNLLISSRRTLTVHISKSEFLVCATERDKQGIFY